MRSLLAPIAVLSLALVTAGCNQTTSGGPITIPGIGTVTQAQISQKVSEVQAAADRYCNYVPTFDTVAQIASTLTGSSIPSTAVAIGRGICNALTTHAARRAAGPARYRGVVIRGAYSR